MNKSIRQLVMELLYDKQWHSGLEIEEYVTGKRIVKASTVSRELRNYAQAGYINRKINKKSPFRYVEYKRVR